MPWIDLDGLTAWRNDGDGCSKPLVMEVYDRTYRVYCGLPSGHPGDHMASNNPDVCPVTHVAWSGA